MAGEGYSADESRVRRDFWPTIKRVARNIPFAEDAVAAYYCALDRETPRHVRIALIGALAYFVTPIDAVPDFLPFIGFADDASVIAAALATIQMHMKDRHREAARRTLEDEDFGGGR
ncbi:YkvA family protein [Methylopila sp. M107]|uniref:YkvA family protein n=1 Tax=Methylopila sp. M107 TaxID=1101190 RepID=UPI000363F548|nr:YkvA family protein [Methylopila sp. M107]